MNRFCLLPLLLVGLFAWGFLAVAAPPEVETRDGHVSPLIIELTGADGKSRKAVLDHLTVPGATPRFKFRYRAVTPEKTVVNIWFDTLSEIKEVGDAQATWVLKNGKRYVLRHGKDTTLTISAEGEADETFALNRLKRVKFLHPARKDGKGNAMFDNWQFSPFTGEKLPKVKD
jgi:hypothetical protein